jgi:hypothetical protein
MHKRSYIEWDVTNDKGNVPTWENVAICVLMDIRVELQKLNAVFACHRFQDIPDRLEAMAKVARRSNTRHAAAVAKRRKAKAA